MDFFRVANRKRADTVLKMNKKRLRVVLKAAARTVTQGR